MLKCKNCGYERLETSYEDYECPICNGKLIIKDKKQQTIPLRTILEMDCIENMKYQIKTYGNDKIWYAIENCINNPKIRLAYRKYFFKANGITPKSEV